MEDLAVSIDSENNTSTVLTVANNGDVTAHLVGVSRRYEGRIGTTRLDIRLAPRESKTITIPAGSYDRIGVLTGRGNLYSAKMEPSALTVLEGTVIDSETREPVRSSIGGEVRSKNIQIEMETDKFGKFRIELPDNLTDGEHSYDLNINSPGYDPQAITGVIEKGKQVDLGVIELNYHPFDIKLSKNGTAIKSKWYHGRGGYRMGDRFNVKVIPRNNYAGTTKYEFVKKIYSLQEVMDYRRQGYQVIERLEPYDGRVEKLLIDERIRYRNIPMVNPVSNYWKEFGPHDEPPNHKLDSPDAYKRNDDYTVSVSRFWIHVSSSEAPSKGEILGVENRGAYWRGFWVKDRRSTGFHYRTVWHVFKVTGAGTHLAVVPGYYCKSGMATLMVWHSEPKGGIENLPKRPKRYDILKGEPYPNLGGDIRWFNKVGTYYVDDYEAGVTEYQGGLWGPSHKYLRTKAEQYNLQFTVNYKLTFKYWRFKKVGEWCGIDQYRWIRKDDVVKYVAPGERKRLYWGIYTPRLRNAYVGWTKVNRMGRDHRYKLVGIEPGLGDENHLHNASTTVTTTIKKYGTTEIANYCNFFTHYYKFYHKIKILGYDANGRHVQSKPFDITEKLCGGGGGGGNGGNGGNEDYDLDTMFEIELVNAETGRQVSPVMCGGRWPDEGESTPVFSWKFIGKGASEDGRSISVSFSDACKPLTLWRVNLLTYGRNPFKIGVRKASGIPPNLQKGTHNFNIEYEARAMGFHPVGEHNKVTLQGRISVALQVKKTGGGRKMVFDQINDHDGNGWIDSDKVTIKLQDFGTFDASFGREEIWLTPGYRTTAYMFIDGDYCKPIEIDPISFTAADGAISFYTEDNIVKNTSVDPSWTAQASNDATGEEQADFRVSLYGTKPIPDPHGGGGYRYILISTSIRIKVGGSTS